MENDKVEIIGTGVLNHYKKDVPYTISKKRLSTIPKDAYTLAEVEVAKLKAAPKPVAVPTDKV